MNPAAPGVQQARRWGGLGAAAAPEARAEPTRLQPHQALKALTECAWRTVVLVARGRLRQPRINIGRKVSFADGGIGTVYRETVVRGREPLSPAVLVVCFRLRGVHSEWAHALFRLESELNTALFAGFPGLVSKLWMRHDQSGLYRGVYQWDDSYRAVSYVRALWWPLALVSEPESIDYAVLPGLVRDEVLTNPALIDDALSTAPGGWWRPV